MARVKLLFKHNFQIHKRLTIWHIFLPPFALFPHNSFLERQEKNASESKEFWSPVFRAEDFKVRFCAELPFSVTTVSLRAFSLNITVFMHHSCKYKKPQGSVVVTFPCVSLSPAPSLLPWVLKLFLLFYSIWWWSCLPLLQDFLTTSVHFYQAVQTWLGALEFKWNNKESGSELAVKELESFNFLLVRLSGRERNVEMADMKLLEYVYVCV